jgi:hypothetical protein
VETLEDNGFITSNLSHTWKRCKRAFTQYTTSMRRPTDFPEYVNEEHLGIDGKDILRKNRVLMVLCEDARWRRLDEFHNIT